MTTSGHSIPCRGYPRRSALLSSGLELHPSLAPLARMVVVVPVVVVVRMVVRGVAALTERIGRHSTARLAVVAAASLVVAQLDEGV